MVIYSKFYEEKNSLDIFNFTANKQQITIQQIIGFTTIDILEIFRILLGNH